jgi:phospholipid/cholesterol/gamma-HCH transport system substrate-binding protein
MEYRKQEIQAGIFLLTSFSILVVMVFAVSDVKSLFKKRKEIKALFTLSDGIEKNAQVRLSGIKIGKVSSIRVAPEQGDRVELTLSIFEDAIIKEDARAAIKTLGLVGGKYVELTPGSPEADLIKPGAAIDGEDSLKMEDLTKAGLDVVAKLQHIALSLDRIVGDPAVKRNITGTLQNVQDVSADLKDISGDVKEIMASLNENKAPVAEAIKDLPVLTKKLDDTLANMREISQKTDAMLGDNRRQIDATMENVKEITANLKDLTEDVKKHPWKLIRKP